MSAKGAPSLVVPAAPTGTPSGPGAIKDPYNFGKALQNSITDGLPAGNTGRRAEGPASGLISGLIGGAFAGGAVGAIAAPALFEVGTNLDGDTGAIAAIDFDKGLFGDQILSRGPVGQAGLLAVAETGTSIGAIFGGVLGAGVAAETVVAATLGGALGIQLGVPINGGIGN